MKKILLIDGNLLLFKSFYAAYSISQEENNMTTNMFLKTILDLLDLEKPSHVFVAFDAHAKTKRHGIFPEYKAGRTSPPLFIYEQKKLIVKILELMKIKWWEQAGDEADDLIAAIATKYQDDHKIVIFSEDKDLLQLIDNNVCVLNKNRKTKLYQYIDNTNFQNLFEMKPHQIVDFKAIAGDPSDNLSGVKGIGPKTAIELIKKFGSLENIYQNLDLLTPSQKLKFQENKEMSFLCKDLAQLNNMINISFSIEEMSFSFDNLVNEDLEKCLHDSKLNRILQNISKNRKD